MAALRTIGNSGVQRGARLHANRERRKSLWDPAHLLKVTHRFAAADNPIDTDAHFPVRTAPITVAFDFVRTGASNGILFEFGDATRGFAAYVDDADLGFVAGENAASDNGVSAVSTGAIGVADQRYRIVVSLLPGAGSINAWLDGQIAAAGVSVNGDLNGSWAADAAGGVGAVATSVLDRVPAGQRATLSNARVMNLRMFQGQLPRQFRAGFTLGSNLGAGSFSGGFDSGFGG